MRNRSNIIELTLKFADKYFPDSKHLMISGSFTEEYFNETSDIDIIILSNLPNKIFIESFNFYNIEFQAIVLPTNQIREMLLKEVHNGEGVYLSLIQKGEILKDHRNFFEKIQNLASLLYKKGPNTTTPIALQLLRGGITSRLTDLKASNSYADNLFTIIDAFQRVITLHSKHNRIWLQKSKYASRLLEKLDPDFKNEIVNAYSDFVRTQNPESCIAFLTTTLEKFGGQLNYISTKEVTNEVKGDILTIYINNSNYHDVIVKLILPFHEYLISRISPIEFVTIKASHLSQNKEGVYLVIKKNNQFINEYLIPSLQDFFIHKIDLRKIKINPLFPYSINPLTLLGYKSIEPEVFSLLSKVTDFFTDKYKITNYTNESVTLDGVRFLILIIRKLNLSEIDCDSFLTFLNDSYLPYSYNLDQEIPYSLLNHEREQLKAKYQNADKLWMEQDLNTLSDYQNLQITDQLSILTNKVSTLQHTNRLGVSEYETATIPNNIIIETKEMWVILRNVISELFNCLYIKDQYKSYVVFMTEEYLKRGK